MNRQEILLELQNITQPITTDLVVFDEGCEFSILTKSAVYECFLGGSFPITGPIKLPKKIHDALIKHLSGISLTLEGEEDDINDLVGTIEFYLGTDALKEMVKKNWQAENEFYVFHNMGWDESAFFTTLDDAYNYFIDYFVTEDNPLVQKTFWGDMSDVALLKWKDTIEEWKSSGRTVLPVEYLGSFYSQYPFMLGVHCIGEIIQSKIDEDDNK